MTEAGTEAKRKSSSVRMKEILRILRRQDIVHGVSPEKLKNILEDLGPFYVKMGQLMSMRSDMLPPSYCDELKKLHADVRPMPFDEVKAQIQAAYGQEVKKVFTSLEPQPLGSASIAQVHKAKLPNGRTVVVKVQRPLVQETISQDIALLKRALRLLKIVVDTNSNINLEAVLDELWLTMQQETNFLLEAEHLQTFADLNRDVAYVACPQLEQALATPKVLVMELIEGIPIGHLKELEEAGYDIDEIGTKLAENYVKQVLDDGFFHADPHPGNLIIRDGQIVWIDLGMVGKLSNRDQTLFKEIAFAIVHKDIYGLKELLLTLGTAQGQLDHIKLHADIDVLLTKYETMDFGNMDFGGFLKEVLGFIKKHDIAMPASITIMSRGMMNMEGLLRACCPGANFMSILSRHIAGDIRKDFDIQKSLGRLGISLYGFFSKSLDLPTQMSNILKMILKGQVKINLALNEAEEPLHKVGRMVDRLVLAIVDAALLVSAGLLCTTNMEPQVWGVPLVGLLGYALAIALAIWLCVSLYRKGARK